MATNANQNNPSPNSMNGLPTLTQTKTRTKTIALVGLGIAAIGAAVWVVAVTRGGGRARTICNSGPNAGQECSRNEDCKRLEARNARCVKAATLADLAVQSVTFIPSTRLPTLVLINSGRSATPAWTSASSDDAPRVTWNWLNADGVVVTERISAASYGIASNLAPGATQTMIPPDMPETPAAATRLRITLDSGSNRVIESNEDNNVWEGDLPPVPRPDLHNLFERIPDTPTEGAPFTLRVRVQNLGTADAGPSTSGLQFDLGNNGMIDETLPTRSVSTIAVGAIAEPMEWNWTAWPSGGPHRLVMCADAGSAVTESDEGNNCSTAVIVANPAPRPDLAIQSVTFDPTTRLPTVITVNQGEAVAASADGRIPQLASWFLNSAGSVVGVGLGDGIRALAPGETQTHNWSRVRTSAPSDAVRLRISIDDRNNILESNEDNNRWEGDMPPLASSVGRLSFTLHPASPAGASVPGLADVLWLNVSASSAEGQVSSLFFSVESRDNNGTGTPGGDWNTWQSSTEFLGLTNSDFLFFDSVDMSTPLVGTWRLYGNEFVLDEDSDTARVLTGAEFTPSTPLSIPTGTNRSFVLRMDTTGANAPANDTLQIDLISAETIGAPEGLPIYGNRIIY